MNTTPPSTRSGQNLPAQKGKESHLEHVTVDVDAFLPPTRTTYGYDGPLTTAPCSEDVKWFVMTTPIASSKAQIGPSRHSSTATTDRYNP